MVDESLVDDGAAVDEAVDAAAQVALRGEEESATISFSTSYVSHVLMGIVDLNSVECDEGEPPAESSTWLPDEEPSPGGTDAWSRNALPTRPKLPGASARQPSLVSLPEGGAHPRRTRRAGSRTGSDKSSFVSDASRLGKLQDLDGMLPPRTTSRRLAPFLEPTVDPRTRAEQLKAEAAMAEVAEAASLRESVGGSDYTYDRHGALILVQPPEGEKLPAFVARSAFSVSEQRASEPQEEVPPARAGGGARGRAAGRRPSGTGILSGRFRSSTEQDAPPFQPSEAEQPALMHSLRLQPGVTLREGGSSAHEKPLREPEHASLADLRRLGDAPVLQLGGGGGGGGGAPSGAPVAAQPGAEPPASAAAPPHRQEPRATPAGARAAEAPTDPRGGGRALVQPMGRPRLDSGIGQRSRLLREKSPLAPRPGVHALGRWRTPLGEPIAAASGFGAEPLPQIPLSLSRSSALGRISGLFGYTQYSSSTAGKMARGSFSRRQPASVIKVTDPQLLDSLFADDLGPDGVRDEPSPERNVDQQQFPVASQ